MRLLLDTHIWLWAVLTPERIAPATRSALEDPHNDILVSAAGAWEIATKHAIGKLPLPESAESLIPRMTVALGAQELSITVRHAVTATTLPPHHRDPFDRILIAQALCEGVALVTADRMLTRYDAMVLWAG